VGRDAQDFLLLIAAVLAIAAAIAVLVAQLRLFNIDRSLQQVLKELKRIRMRIEGQDYDHKS
jgi:HAMP domain-containing protein